jgi:hypothetical protein
MGLELLKEADYILDACGRPVPPPGFKFVDLPRVINFTTIVPGAGPVATQFRVTNNAKTLFLCRGISTTPAVPYRIKWPNGRFFDQNPFDGQLPAGRAGTMLAFDREQPIEKGARIGVEHVGGPWVTPPPPTGPVSIDFWGVLRYLIKEVDDGAEPPGNYCIVGYPAKARSQKTGSWKLSLVDDPITALESIPRYMCGPNQNIMAPEFLLGDGSWWPTPAGCTDESFSFFSDPITVTVNDASYGHVVIVPGHDKVIVKRWRTRTTWAVETTGIPAVSMRLPNGYSITGGDFMPMVYDWMPFFPTLGVTAGTRIVLDVTNVGGVGTTLTTVVEFEGVKRTGCV